MKKLSDQITRFQNNVLKLLQKHWGRVLLAVVTFAGCLLLIIWINEPALHERLDLTLKTIGGLFLIIGIGIAIWRSAIFERQIESSVKGQYSERFAKAVEQIADDQLAIRLGGLASIEALSKETEDEFRRAWKYLGEFLRYPPKLAEWSDKPRVARIEKEQEELLGRRPDIVAVAAMLHDIRNKTHLRWITGNQLPLQQANLQSADLQGARLFKANLQGAKLRKANLQGAVLFSVELQGAELQGANLQGAELFHAELQDAELQDIDLQNADLRYASLREKELQQLFSKGNSSLLKDALFSLATLKEALHIKDFMPEKMSAVYYLDSEEPLPDDWPDDYKPRPITYVEWRKKRKATLNSSN